MKPALIISTIFNLILSACLVIVLKHKYQEASLPALPVKVTIRQTAPVVAAMPMEPQAKPKPFRWSQLESSDYPTYVRNLRNSGCPEPTVRAIVTADVDSAYWHESDEIEQKLKNLANDSLTAQFKSYDETQALKARLQKIPAEENSEITYLLGTTPVTPLAATDAEMTSVPTRAGTNATTSSTQPSTDAATTSLSTQPSIDADNTDFASASSASPGSRNPVQSFPIVYPVVFQKVDSTSLNLNSDQVQAIQNLQQSFADQIGDPNQYPSDYAYRLRWRQSQVETDNELRFILGWGGFSSYQMLAQQGDASDAAAVTP